MTHLEIKGCPDDSPANDNIASLGSFFFSQESLSIDQQHSGVNQFKHSSGNGPFTPLELIWRGFAKTYDS